MSKKKDRGWFVCPRWSELVLPHYTDDAALARALNTNPSLLGRVREQTPVARSTLLKLLRRFGGLHAISTPGEYIVDTRR